MQSLKDFSFSASRLRTALIGISMMLLVFLTACTDDQEVTEPADPVTSESAQKPEKLFSESRLHNNIKTLASDEFEGRLPNTIGEEKTINFLKDQFAELGVSPGNGDSYFQQVSLVEMQADADMTMRVAAGGDSAELNYQQDMMAWTRRVVDASPLKDSEIVFVGYGVVAPEYDWNDYAGLDMTGKTALILVNDPGFATQNPELFKGNRMTYYGRWSYKFDEAAKQGAAGAIIVHEEAAAGYPWQVVSGGWAGPQFDLVAQDNNMSLAQIEGWVTQENARRILSLAGQDFDALSAEAQQPGFKPVAIEATVSVDVKNSVKRSTSNNVVAMIPGTERPEETIIFTAHWDHLGKREGDGDQIYNGAVDNASGTAGLIELAAAFMQADAPERSLVFLAVTAEEAGLLGSKHYAENPVFDLADTVATINIDGANVLGKTKDIIVVGDGSSELEDYLRDEADTMGRVLVPEPTPEKGFYYRSDHFNFAKKGVPSLYAEGGIDYVDQPQGWGLEQQANYTKNRYHKAADEYDPNWDLSGMLQDLELYYRIADKLSNESTFPNWREGNEFKAIRDHSRRIASANPAIRAVLTRADRSQSDKNRDRTSKPDLILDLLNIQSGDQVLDVFAGGGYYSSILSDLVGEEGKVLMHNNQGYAAFAAAQIEARFLDGKPQQIQQHNAEIEALQLDPDSLDAVILVMSFHDLYWVNEESNWSAIDADDFLDQIEKALKDDGKLLIVDHSAAEGSELAGVDAFHRIDEAYAQARIESRGFTLSESSDALRNPNDSRDISVFDAAIRGKTDRFIHLYQKSAEH